MSQVLSVLEETAKAVRGEYPDLLWNKVDGDASAENAKEFEGVRCISAKPALLRRCFGVWWCAALLRCAVLLRCTKLRAITVHAHSPAGLCTRGFSWVRVRPHLGVPVPFLYVFGNVG